MGGVCPGVTGDLGDSAGSVGSTATMVITSERRSLYGEYYIYWGQWLDEPDEVNFQMANEFIHDRNTHEIKVDFVVPEVPYKAGSGYFILFYNQILNPEGGAAATMLFKIEPTIEIKPSPASPGTELAIDGTGFTANDIIELSFDGKVTDTALQSNNRGSFSTKFTIPDTMAGNHTFKASAERMYTADASFTIGIVPHISLDPELPDIGTEAIITGRGFAAGSEVSLEYDDIAITSSPATDGAGSFSHTFHIPESDKSEHNLTVTDKAGNTATLSLSLEGKAPPTSATLSPRGQRIGWFGSQEITFRWKEVADTSGVTYTVEVADNLAFFPVSMRRSELTQPQCRLKLEPGTYYWRARAIDGAGNEGEWALSPYPFKVGFISMWHVIIGGFILIGILVLLIRTLSRRLSEYYH